MYRIQQKKQRSRIFVGIRVNNRLLGGDEKNDIALLLIELLLVMTEMTRRPIVSSTVIVFEITWCSVSAFILFAGSM